MHKQFAVLLILCTVFPVAAAEQDAVLRTEIEGAVDALVLNDRPAFDEHYARVKANPGAANDKVAGVLDDAALVWDALFLSPFFEEGSAAYRQMSAYPGYADAVRRSVLKAGDQRLYPAADSLRFLTRIAAAHLGRSETTPALPRVARARRTKT